MSIFDLFSSDSGTNAARRGYRAVKQGLNTGKEDIQQYTGKAQDYLTQAFAPWDTLGTQGGQGAAQYYGLLGVGSPEQIASARAAWQASPANEMLQYGLGQGQEGLMRKGFGTGQTGQTNMDVMSFINNLTNQDLYGQYLPALAPSLNQQLASAQGKTGISSSLADLMSGTGTNLANLDVAKGQAGNTLQQQIYGAKQGAASNSLNALFGLGSLAMAPFTGGGSLLGGMFGGGGGTGAFDSMMQGGGFMDNAGNIY